MNPDDLAMAKDIADVVGTASVLFIMVLLFYRGDIISRHVYEKLVERTVSETAERIAEKVCSVVEKMANKLDETDRKRRR